MFATPWAILGLLLVVRVVMGFQFQAVASMTPVIAADVGLDFTQLGALVGFYMLPGIFIAIPVAILGSRFKDLTMVLFGLGIMALGGIVAGLADGFTMLAAGRLLSGAGAVIQSIFVVKMVADWFDIKSVATAMAILLCGWPVGIAIALLTLGPIADTWGWQPAMHGTALGCILAIGIVGFFYRPPPGQKTGTASGIGFHMARPELSLICFAGLLWTVYNLAYFSFLSFGPALLMERGLDVVAAGGAISLTSWAALPALPLGGYVADRTGRPGMVLLVCCLLAAAATTALPLVDYPFVLCGAIGLFAAAPAGVIMGRAISLMSPSHRALGNAILYTFFYGGMGLGTGMFGWSADYMDTAAAPIYLGATCLILTIPLYLGLHLMARAKPA